MGKGLSYGINSFKALCFCRAAGSYFNELAQNKERKKN